MEREEFINALSSFNPEDLKTIVKQANKLIAEEKKKRVEEKEEREKEKREEIFKSADPFTLAVHHVKRDNKVKLSYDRKRINGEDIGTSEYVGKKDVFHFRFKLEEGSDVELIVELGTVKYNGEYYDGGYPAYCEQILKIRGEEVHKKFNRSDRRGGDKNDFSESYDLLKQAGIPQSEIDKVDAVLPKELYKYERD